MPVTNFKISMNEYLRLVAKDAKKAEGNPIYSKLLKDLSDFSAMMMEYFETNEQGKAKTLTADDYNKLIKGYTTLAEDCNIFLSVYSKNQPLISEDYNENWFFLFDVRCGSAAFVVFIIVAFADLTR